MKKITVLDFLKSKKEGRKLVLLTAYDYTFARLLDETGVIDGILVGDSLGMVIKGEEDTLSVDIEEVAYHVRSVKKGVKRTFIIADMPFGSYQPSFEKGVENAVYLIKSGADAVKVEGGSEVVPFIKKLVSSGIPVMGHVGMTPQYKNVFGGYRLRGRDRETEEKIKEDAVSLEEAGVFSIVVEMVPERLGKSITERLKIPTIGIGAGRYTDGQILVLYDVLGLYRDLNIKFVKRYADGYDIFNNAIKRYAEDVREGRFPAEENVYD